MNPKQMGSVFKVMNAFTKIKRAGATLGLAFIGRNPVRDQWTAGVNSQYGYVPFMGLARGLFEMTLGKAKGGQYYEKFLQSGASSSQSVSPDIRKGQARVEDMLATKNKLLREYRKDVREHWSNAILWSWLPA
jgi:hypothetical protein